MNEIKIIKDGNKTHNPEYNPKTKKRPTQPPTSVDYNPGTSIRYRGRGR